MACGHGRTMGTGREEVTQAQSYSATVGRGRLCQIGMEELWQ